MVIVAKIGLRRWNVAPVIAGSNPADHPQNMEAVFMLTTSQLGNLGESKAISEFIKHGFEVYTQFSGNNLFDFIAYRDDKLYKVEVKTTNTAPRYGSYVVYLNGTAYGPNRTIIHKPFNKLVDILSVYIYDLNVLCFVNCKVANIKKNISFRKKLSNHGHYKQWIIEDYFDLEKAL